MLIDLSLLKKNRNYRQLYLGQGISFLGNQMVSVALPYQVYHQIHSSLLVGLLSFCQWLPLLFSAIIGGSIADRFNRRWVMMICEVLFCGLSLLLIINAAKAAPSTLLLFIVGFCMFILVGIHRPAGKSVLQAIVEKEDYPALSNLWSLQTSTAMIVGPSLAGLFIAHIGLSYIYFADLLTFLFSLSMLLRMKWRDQIRLARSSSAIESIVSGFRYAFHRDELAGSYYVDFIAMLFGMPNALFPAIASHLGGPQVLGLMYASPALGGFAISLLSGWTHKITYYGRAITYCAAIWGALIIGLAFVTSAYQAIIILILAGIADFLSSIFRSIMWNQIIPNEMRGRLAGIEMLSYMSGPMLGNFEAGLMASLLGVSFSIFSGGVLCILGVGMVAWKWPKFWNFKS